MRTIDTTGSMTTHHLNDNSDDQRAENMQKWPSTLHLHKLLNPPPGQVRATLLQCFFHHS